MRAGNQPAPQRGAGFSRVPGCASRGGAFTLYARSEAPAPRPALGPYLQNKVGQQRALGHRRHPVPLQRLPVRARDHRALQRVRSRHGMLTTRSWAAAPDYPPTQRRAAPASGPLLRSLAYSPYSHARTRSCRVPATESAGRQLACPAAHLARGCRQRVRQRVPLRLALREEPVHVALHLGQSPGGREDTSLPLRLRFCGVVPAAYRDNPSCWRRLHAECSGPGAATERLRDPALSPAAAAALTACPGRRLGAALPRQLGPAPRYRRHPPPAQAPAAGRAGCAGSPGRCASPPRCGRGPAAAAPPQLPDRAEGGATAKQRKLALSHSRP